MDVGALMFVASFFVAGVVVIAAQVVIDDIPAHLYIVFEEGLAVVRTGLQYRELGREEDCREGCA